MSELIYKKTSCARAYGEAKMESERFNLLSARPTFSRVQLNLIATER